MTMEERFIQCWSEIRILDPLQCPSASLFSLVDLTKLDENANVAAIQTVMKAAETHEVAALCVLPQQLSWIDETCTVPLATVVNFPTGNQTQDLVLETIDKAKIAHEIDYVFPYQTYLHGDKTTALLHCKTIYEYCKTTKRLFKVILETGAFPSLLLIYQLSRELIDIGCDFLKTSTGKIAIGATLPATYAILSAMVDANASCGIKCSGGIKTRAAALEYLVLAQYLLHKKPEKTWFRLGSSMLWSS